MYCRHIFFTQFAGRELLGVGVGVGGCGYPQSTDGGTKSKLHENANAEMVARKKNPRFGEWA